MIYDTHLLKILLMLIVDILSKYDILLTIIISFYFKHFTDLLFLCFDVSASVYDSREGILCETKKL